MIPSYEHLALSMMRKWVRKNLKEVLTIFASSFTIVNWLKGLLPSRYDLFMPSFNPPLAISRDLHVWDYLLVGGRPFVYMQHLGYDVPIYLLSSFLPINIANAIVFWFLYFTSGLSMYLFVLDTLNLNESSKKSALIAALLYMFNPYWVFRITDAYFSVIWIYSLLPLLMLLSRRALVTVSRSLLSALKYIVLGSLVTLAMSEGFSSIPIGMSAGLFLIIYLFLLGLWLKKLKSFAIMVVMLSTFILLTNLWWIGPQFTLEMISSILARSEFYVKQSLAALEVQSQYTTYLNLIRLMPYDLRYTILPMIQFYGSTIFAIISISLPIIVFMPLLSKRNYSGSEMIIFSVLILLYIPFLSGLNPPFGFINRWLMENFPLFVLRRPDTTVFTLQLSYSYLFGLAMSHLMSSKNYKKLGRILGTLLVVTIIVSTSFPFISGHEIKYLCPTPDQKGWQQVSVLSSMPAYVEDVIKYLDAAPSQGGVLVLPWEPSPTRGYNWSQGYFGLDVYYLALGRPVLSGVDANYPMYYIYAMIDYAIGTNRSGLGNLLRTLGIKYIVVAEDALRCVHGPIGRAPNVQQIEDYLAKQQDIKMIDRFGKHVLYEVIGDPSPTFYAVTKLVPYQAFASCQFPVSDYVNPSIDLDPSKRTLYAPILCLLDKNEDVVLMNESTLKAGLSYNQSQPVIKVEEIRPTTFRIYVNADSPFVLASNIVFDESWVAYVNGYPLKHIQVNYMFNGYIINNTGAFSIEINYIKQSYADAFLFISLIFVFVLLTSLLMVIHFELREFKYRDGLDG